MNLRGALSTLRTLAAQLAAETPSQKPAAPSKIRKRKEPDSAVPRAAHASRSRSAASNCIEQYAARQAALSLGASDRYRCLLVICDTILASQHNAPQSSRNAAFRYARDIEMFIFLMTGGNVAAYAEKVREIVRTLIHDPALSLSNAPKALVCGRFLYPDGQPDNNDEDAGEEDDLDQLFGTANMKPMATCGRCKIGRIETERAQTRGGDEGQTTYCRCLNCGHRWRSAG